MVWLVIFLIVVTVVCVCLGSLWKWRTTSGCIWTSGGWVPSTRAKALAANRREVGAKTSGECFAFRLKGWEPEGGGGFEVTNEAQ